MKFITEQDLRDCYRKASFSVYPISGDVRLTPEARQFLQDRKIAVTDVCKVKELSAGPKVRRLEIKFQWIRSLFLATGEQMLSVDLVLAQKILNLDEQLRMIRHLMDQEKEIPDLECEPCTGIKQENFSEDLGDCFEVTAFHAQMKRGKEITALHHLRCGLREFLCMVQDIYTESSKEKGLLIERYILQIINQLNQLLCSCMGGTLCQR